MRRIAIDPAWGGPGSACAEFHADTLIRVWFDRGDKSITHEPTAVVIEMPQADNRSEHVSADSLIKLSFAAGWIAGRYAERGHHVSMITPRKWKGNVPKPQHHFATWRALRDAERQILGGRDTYDLIDAACDKGAMNRWCKPGASYYPRGNTMHNILDAVALGLHSIGRI